MLAKETQENTPESPTQEVSEVPGSKIIFVDLNHDSKSDTFENQKSESTDKKAA